MSYRVFIYGLAVSSFLFMIFGLGNAVIKANVQAIVAASHPLLRPEIKPLPQAIKPPVAKPHAAQRLPRMPKPEEASVCIADDTCMRRSLILI